jgi:hypothetical protein
MVVVAYGALNASLKEYECAYRQDEGKRDSKKTYGFPELQIGKDQRCFII